MVQQAPDFESLKHIDMYGEERWSARELGLLLGYKSWQNFEVAIHKAQIACQESGNDVERCFNVSIKTSPMPNGGVKNE